MEEENKPVEPVKVEIPKAANMVESAQIAAERLEKANAVMLENINKLENLQAIQKLGGSTDAGKPTESQELTPKEYKDAVEKGLIK